MDLEGDAHQCGGLTPLDKRLSSSGPRERLGVHRRCDPMNPPSWGRAVVGSNPNEVEERTVPRQGGISPQL